MSLWKLAAVLVGFMPMTRAQRAAWAVLLGSALLPLAFHNLWFMLAIDLTAFALLYRGVMWSQGIAIGFAAMALVEAVSLAVLVPSVFYSFMILVGWLQLALLVAWAWPKRKGVSNVLER